MSGTLFTAPRFIPVNSSGRPYPAAKLYFYRAGTTTLATVYTNSALTVPSSNPLTANSAGMFDAVYLNPSSGFNYKAVLQNSSGSQLWSEDNIPATFVTAAAVGLVLYPRSSAEISAGVTPTDYTKGYGNVKRFGATGNGVTDDTTALANALSVAGSVYIPAGTYLISNRLSVLSNTVIEGEGTIKLADNSALSLTNGPMLLVDSKSDVTIRGITLDGNKAENDINDNYGDGIRAYSCLRLRVESCRFLNLPRDGISIAKHPTTGNHLDIVITNNIVSGCGAASQTTGGEGIIVVEGQRIVISDNICTGNLLRGIEVETLTSVIENVTITGNVCNGNTRGIGVNGATNVTISANACDGNTTSGISLESSVAITGLCAVSGNKVSSSPVGIDVIKYDYITFTGNVIETCTEAVQINDGNYLVFTGNLFYNNTAVFDTATGTNTNLIVRNNSGYVTENSGTATVLSGATTVVVTHGLGYTPTAAEIALTFAEQGTSDYGRWWVSTITSTQFTINVSADPGASNLDIGWSARRI